MRRRTSASAEILAVPGERAQPGLRGRQEATARDAAAHPRAFTGPLVLRHRAILVLDRDDARLPVPQLPLRARFGAGEQDSRTGEPGVALEAGRRILEPPVRLCRSRLRPASPSRSRTTGHVARARVAQIGDLRPAARVGKGDARGRTFVLANLFPTAVTNQHRSPSHAYSFD